MPFIRVRAVSGPRHEFDVSQKELDRYPELYKVIDPKPVDESRPVRYVTPGRKARK